MYFGESRTNATFVHDLLKLIRQRVLQIVAGYEDCNGRRYAALGSDAQNRL